MSFNKKGIASYTYVVHADQVATTKSLGMPIPLQHANFEVSSVREDEISVASLVSSGAPCGAVIPKVLESNFSFFCQIYSSDFPAPFQDALYMTDAVGYLLVNKQMGNDVADGCFFVQVA